MHNSDDKVKSRIYARGKQNNNNPDTRASRPNHRASRQKIEPEPDSRRQVVDS